MTISSRTPEGLPSRCPLCGAATKLEFSLPSGDAPCPNCGHLLWSSAELLSSFQNRFAETLGVATDRITPDTTFAELGADSLDTVELVMELEEEFDISIPDDAAERIQNVGDLIRYVSRQQTTQQPHSEPASMSEPFKDALVQQFHAALSMLRASVVACPDNRWEANVGTFPFWHVAYHTLYITDLYLSPNLGAFAPRSFHREHYEFFGRLPWPPFEEVVADNPFDKRLILDYVQLCREKASASVAAETDTSLSGPSGFDWYKIPRGEFHLNNIRHIQHHAAQMSLALRRSDDIEIGWVGFAGPADS